MKKIAFFCFCFASSYIVNAQNNTFPASGNVGVGTISPDQKLTIKGGGIGFDWNSTDKKLYAPSDGVLEWMTHDWAGEKGFAVSHQGTKRVFLNISGNSYFNGGNLGIGITNPTASLDIGGQIQISAINSILPPQGLSYGLYPYGGVGLGIFSGAVGVNQGIGIWTNLNNTPVESIRILAGGNMGIGVMSPNEKLTINGNIFLNSLRSEIYGTDRNHMIVLRGRHDGTVIDETGYYQYGDHVFYTGGMVGSQVEKLRIKNNGNIGIGTTTPTDKLTVNGNIRAKKLIVTQSGWSDYVFAKNYKLRPLAEVENYIKVNQHLPEVPSAKEVAVKGINVGDTQALLLKKIEELTLYVIKQQKQINKLEKGQKGQK